MLTDIHFDTESKTYLKNLMTEAELRRLVQAAAKPRQPQRQRLPKRSALRKLVTSLGYTAP
jgi:hypothetical protein